MSELPKVDSPEIREALEELQQYLSDDIPPLFFANSIQILFKAPAEVVAAQIVGWAMSQQSPGGPLPTADYIFHAAKKIHMLAELELLSKEMVIAYLTELKPALMEGCPAADRAGLAVDLSRLDLDVAMTGPGGVEVVYRRATADTEPRQRHRAGAGEASLAGDDLDEVSRSFGEGLKKLDFLLQRLDLDDAAPLAGKTVAISPSGQGGLAAELMTQATVGAENAEELDKFLTELKRRGLPATPEGLMGMLATNLPDWAPPPVESDSEEAPPQAAVRAMHRFISLAKDQEESQRRFDELVDTAVAEFNKGSLGRAVTLLDLAGSMAAKKEVDGVFSQSVQRRAHSKLDMEKLRASAESEEKHHLLRRFLAFFHQLSPEELLIELEEEESRDRRRFLLDLLTVHGPVARKAVFSDLSEVFAGTAAFPWYYKRNLVHLLRSIPREPDEPVESEIDILVGMSELNDQLQLVREALTALGQLQHPRAVTALAARVNEIEDGLLGQQELPHEDDQLRFLLDSSIKALVRMSTGDARRAVVAHGLKRQPELGDTVGRMVWLAGQDLSGEKDLIDRLVREIRAELPKRVFGLTLKTGRKEYVVETMIRALAATNTQTVRDLLQEIARDFAGQPFADAAQNLLNQMTAPTAEARPGGATLSGDLELFGLPNLLQNFADSQIGGVLIVFDRSGGTAAKMWLEGGRVLGAESGILTAEVAIYQLLEDPAPGRFELASTDDEPPQKVRTAEPLAIQSILFEGIRRYDEFKRAAAAVPDEARFHPTGSQPTLAEGDSDEDLFNEAWRRAAAGYSPVECEKELPVDRFRVRCLFEHWLAEGALAPAKQEAPAADS
jgi:hypothetical protein